MKDSIRNRFLTIKFIEKQVFSPTSTSIIIANDCWLDSVGSITHVQFALFGYSLGNDGLIRFNPFDDVILRFEHTSTIVESKKRMKYSFYLYIDIFLLLIHW